MNTRHSTRRMERDLVGEMEIPAEAYYGVHTARAMQNFPISGRALHPEMIRSLALIKKAAALSLRDAGMLSGNIAGAIVAACEDVMTGTLNDQFPVDAIQGGAGTSANMNANEVIANRAIERLGGRKGDYRLVNPNDHVNCGQSTNDVYPSAGKLTVVRLFKPLLLALEALRDALQERAIAFDGVVKAGRTQLQDAVPIRLGQEFQAYTAAVERDISRLSAARLEMMTLNLGGTAIGTGVNASEAYARAVVKYVNRLSGEPFAQADNLIDSTQNVDDYVRVSSALKACAVNLTKISNDLRLMASGPRAGLGEISLPARQNGSSIMPGKVNPVIPEVVNQIAFAVMGNDVTITLAAQAGQLELNAFEPVILDRLFESISWLTNGVRTFTENCVRGIVANEARCRELAEQSTAVATALCPSIGYARAATLAKEALSSHMTVEAVAKRDGLAPELDLHRMLDPYAMTVSVQAEHHRGRSLAATKPGQRQNP